MRAACPSRNVGSSCPRERECGNKTPGLPGFVDGKITGSYLLRLKGMLQLRAGIEIRGLPSPLLTGKALDVYSGLSSEDAGYDSCKGLCYRGMISLSRGIVKI